MNRSRRHIILIALLFGVVWTVFLVSNVSYRRKAGQMGVPSSEVRFDVPSVNPVTADPLQQLPNPLPLPSAGKSSDGASPRQKRSLAEDEALEDDILVNQAQEDTELAPGAGKISALKNLNQPDGTLDGGEKTNEEIANSGTNAEQFTNLDPDEFPDVGEPVEARKTERPVTIADGGPTAGKGSDEKRAVLYGFAEKPDNQSKVWVRYWYAQGVLPKTVVDHSKLLHKHSKSDLINGVEDAARRSLLVRLAVLSALGGGNMINIDNIDGQQVSPLLLESIEEESQLQLVRRGIVRGTVDQLDALIEKILAGLVDAAPPLPQSSEKDLRKIARLSLLDRLEGSGGKIGCFNCDSKFIDSLLGQLRCDDCVVGADKTDAQAQMLYMVDMKGGNDAFRAISDDLDEVKAFLTGRSILPANDYQSAAVIVQFALGVFWESDSPSTVPKQDEPGTNSKWGVDLAIWANGRISEALRELRSL